MKRKLVRKMFASLLAASMVIGMAGCGDQPGNQDGGGTSQSNQPTSDQSTPNQSTPDSSTGSSTPETPAATEAPAEE